MALIVYDIENIQAWGPYDSEKEAAADLQIKAERDGWGDILASIEMFGEDIWLQLDSSLNLAIAELFPPEPKEEFTGAPAPAAEGGRL